MEMDYEGWLAEWFPHVASKPLAPHHRGFWAWVTGLREGEYREPYFLVIARGGGKSTTLELGVAFTATTLARRFVLIVCETQEQANARVSAIRTLLERLGERPATTARGQQKGWRIDHIRTARGFNVTGIGLDTAARGLKLDEFRPDWIALDDLDGLHDTPQTTAKKELTLTASILGMGAVDCVVSGTQNLVLEDGLFARVAFRRSDYLANALVNGPHPAIAGFEAEAIALPDGKREYRIVAGEPTWAGQDLAACEEQLNKIGLAAFRREMQHEVAGAQGWVFDPGQIEIGPPDSPVVRSVVTMDLAGTENGGDWTVLGHFAALLNRRTWLLHLERMRKEPLGVRTAIVAFALAAWREYPGTVVQVLQDPAQAGKYQFAQIRQDLIEAGFPAAQLEPDRPLGSKAVRARGFAEDVNAGRVGMVSADWNEAYRTVLRDFREDMKHLYDDDVDVSSSASNYFWRKPGLKNEEQLNPIERRLRARRDLLGR